MSDQPAIPRFSLIIAPNIYSTHHVILWLFQLQIRCVVNVNGISAISADGLFQGRGILRDPWFVLPRLMINI